MGDSKMQADYKTLLEDLMYLMIQTQLNLAYFISIYAQFISNPHKENWTALKRVLKYLQGI